MAPNEPEKRRRYEFWHEVVVPAGKGLERFFWNLVWFLLITCALFHNELKGLWK